MKNRIRKTAIWIMCMLLLIGVVNPMELFAKESISLVHEGNVVDAVSFDSGSKYLLETNGNGGYSKFQWQILNKYSSDEEWVDIVGQDQSKIELSYAMLKEQLENGKTKIRICAEARNGTKEYRAVSVQVEESGSKLNETGEKKETEKSAENTSDAVPIVNYENIENLSNEQMEENNVPESQIEGASNGLKTVSEDEYVTIEIDYTYDFGVKAFDSYIATLVKGAQFSASVTSPSITGYHPVMTYNNGEEVDALNVIIDFSAGVNENVKYEVIYKPSLVNYSVKYFFQNINDDLYREDVAEEVTDKGYTNALPDEKYFNKAYAGFSSLTSDADFISADGSTIYEVFYNRNYYLINFKLDGGYGVEPIYARYEKSFVVNTPIKQGYEFKGWDLLDVNGEGDGNPDKLPSRIPSESRTYKALWDVKKSPYTIVYWKENANNDGYSYWGESVEYAESGTAVSGSDDVKEKDFSNQVVQEAVAANGKYSAIRAYKEYEYFTFDHADSDIDVKGDGSTVVNVYYTRNKYELRFYYARSTGTRYQIASSTTSGDLLNNSWYMISSLPTFIDSSLKSGQESISGYTYYYFSLTAKYGESISDRWPSALCNQTQGYSLINWGPNDGCKYRTVNGNNASIAGAYATMSAELILDPSNSLGNRLLGWWTNDAKVKNQTYRIYYELLPDAEVTDDCVNYNGKYYKLENTLVFPSVYNTYWTRFDPIEYPGMISVNSYGIECDYNNPTHESHDFYYDRSEHTLSYFNHNSLALTPESKTVVYGEPIKKYNVEDMSGYYPDTLEKGAYSFSGWYVDPSCMLPVDWNNEVITENITLYAKWEAVSHDVSVYSTYNDSLNGTNEYAHFVVPHGNSVKPDASFTEPKREGYSFVGWFYIDNGEKVAFDFNDITIIGDVDVFADWSSDVIVDYEIKYVTKDKDGQTVEIAEPTVGRTFAGYTKTFKAKTSSDLNKEFSSHYYPLTSSHSIILDTDETKNTYTFEYICLEKVPYTIKYVDKTTGEVLSEDKNVPDNEASVVTEKFKYIKNYVPDAFYKKLILSANEKENVITFYYVPDSDHAYYAVKYYTQNTELGGYDEYIVIEGVGDIGTEAVAEELNIPGFTLNAEKSTMKGMIDGNGLELSLYYDKNSYAYTINYLEYGTDKTLSDSVTLSDYYGETITVKAKDLDGYVLVGEGEKSVTITERQDRNVINFYYKAAEVVIQYKIVTTNPTIENACSLSLSQEILNSSANLRGSKPLFLVGTCEFVGWYYDEECTMPVEANLIMADNTIMPKYESAVYYAKFRPYPVLPSAGENTALLITLIGFAGIIGYSVYKFYIRRKEKK